MNEYFQENKRSLLILISLLFVLVIVLYFLLLRPLMIDLSKQERAIEAKKADIQLLEVQLENMKKELSEEDPKKLVLEKKIPTERKLDEYILSLEQLEKKTKSLIDHIEFTYDSNMGAIETDETDNEEENEYYDKESTITQEIIQEKPDELQVMTVRFTATSPTFNEFIELLKVIENEERISIVSQLNFRQPTVYDLDEDEDESVSFTVHLTTFYYME